MSALNQWVEQVRAAAAAKTQLRIRGGGSKDFYRPGGQGELRGELLDTTAFNGIVSYEPSELVVTVRAGTPLAELEAALADQGQCLPFEPPHFQISHGASQATVGGMVAAGLSGPARASVGGVRDYMLGVQILNGRAELLNFGGTVMKNVAGYDVSRLMVGALGTLGLITEVSLKVLPVAPAEATLVFELPQAQALAQLHLWGAQPLPLNASCWVHDDAPQASAPGDGASRGTSRSDSGLGGRELLFVRLRGAVAAVESACHKMLQQAAGSRLDNAAAAPDWLACRDLRLPFFAAPTPGANRVLWRLSVPQTAPVLPLPWPQFVEWHGGLRWLWAPLDAAQTLHDAALRVGGSASLFIANYSTPTGTLGTFDSQTLLNPALKQIHSRLKAEFDPAHVFNPGRLLADL